MKFAVVICAFVVIIATFTSAVPLEQEDEGLILVRSRRATCDLLSISTPIGSLNHAACAAHCLAMRKGFRGGRCRDGVCHCRK